MTDYRQKHSHQATGLWTVNSMLCKQYVVCASVSSVFGCANCFGIHKSGDQLIILHIGIGWWCKPACSHTACQITLGMRAHNHGLIVRTCLCTHRHAGMIYILSLRRSDIAERDSNHLSALCQQPWPLTAPRGHPPYLLQLRVLSTRLMRKLYRHPFLILVNFLATLVTAVALGLIFRNAGVDTGGIQNRLGCLFFMLLYLSMMSLSSLPIWRAEKLLFIRSAVVAHVVMLCWPELWQSCGFYNTLRPAVQDCAALHSHSNLRKHLTRQHELTYSTC